VTPLPLQQENRDCRGRGGVSSGSFGFLPACRDLEAGRIFASRFADGRPAAVHVIDELPDGLVICKRAVGTALVLKNSVVAGSTWCDWFFTREQAVRIVSQQAPVIRSAKSPAPPHRQGMQADGKGLPYDTRTVKREEGVPWPSRNRSAWGDDRPDKRPPGIPASSSSRFFFSCPHKRYPPSAVTPGPPRWSRCRGRSRPSAGHTGRGGRCA
jgi:hypothetical protein